MKKSLLFLLCCMSLVACSKHDPILPGVRHDIFDSVDVDVQNIEIPKALVGEKNVYGDKDCEYRQDSSNVIWRENEKIFSGFAMDNSVKSNQTPICDGGFIYTGFSTGEVVEINPKNKNVVWVADVFRASNLTGGASVVDIVARVGVDRKFVYAGGLGDAFCKLNKSNGDKLWCVNISVPVDFTIVDDFAFVVGTDNNLYAVNVDNGRVYWKTEVNKQVKPVYKDNVVLVGKTRINPKNGEILK